MNSLTEMPENHPAQKLFFTTIDPKAPFAGCPAMTSLNYGVAGTLTGEQFNEAIRLVGLFMMAAYDLGKQDAAKLVKEVPADVMVKLHQFTFRVNRYSGAVTQIMTNGSSVPLNHEHAMVPKVYAAYWREYVQTGSKDFNSHLYAKVFGRVINVNTGNQVKDMNILKLFGG